MSNKNNNLEKKFNKFNSMSDEQIQKLENLNNVTSFEKMQEIEEKLRIEPIQNKIDEMNKKIENLELNISNTFDEKEKGKKYIELAGLKDQKDILEKQVKDEKQKIANEISENKKDKILIEGFSKNKEKILKVREYKSKIEKSLQEKTKQIDVSKNNLKVFISRKAEIEEKLKKSEELTNPEYNDLIEEKQKVEQQIEKAKKTIEELEKNIISKNIAISKCDLVWKNLFMDKSWDEINLKAVRMNNKDSIDNTQEKTFTAKAKDKIKKCIKVGKEKLGLDIKENSKEDRNQNNNDFSKDDEQEENSNKIDEEEIQNEDNTEQDEEKGMKPYKEKFLDKHPKIAKMLNKIKNVFKGKSEQEKNDIANEAISKSNGNLKDNKKDAFVENLRITLEDKQHMTQKGRESLNQIHGKPVNPKQKGDGER